ncbi:hypothetical protein Leryth_022109 [Lithospermum erythrorhizon]|nr:hypothetical protein Leryth_022109 [Lithospermum erythrorhizon]
MSLTAPGPCGTNTAEDFDDAPISFIVSKYCVTRIMSITSFADVPRTFSEKASTLSRNPSTIAFSTPLAMSFFCSNTVSNSNFGTLALMTKEYGHGNNITTCFCVGHLGPKYPHAVRGGNSPNSSKEKMFTIENI